MLHIYTLTDIRGGGGGWGGDIELFMAEKKGMENKQSSKQVLQPCKGMNRLCINNKIGGHTNYKLNNLFMYTVYLKIKFKSHPMLTDYVQHYFTLYEMNNKYFHTSKTGNISSLLVFKSVYF